ncbi:glycoside hydrolase family 16 protein [Pedobacter hiemivivus]|uniref:Glycoside hydrolase family 16 protein n=1 Tax=Pedobacter hiemivivus TaxID=2530454 RepID=A0A4V5PEM8_9SPHI|nr:glycoside hydrolase family 16 protein [Pedobacter hiemivivus]TKC65576.1 glycoside hydrolase family 16 protein [Pedobacter hiemivivus]
MKEYLLLPLREMRPFYTIVCLLVFQIQVNAQAPVGYKLSWSDEFNATSLDTTMWKYRVGVSGTSYQRSENVTLEDGKVMINLKKETYKNQSYTGGGIITKRPKKYGYYETRVKLDGGYGWHEAFWTSWMSGFDDKNPAYKNMDRLEIDCFEHYAEYANNYFTYGAIQWWPIKKNANRDYVTVNYDLTAGYQVFGFEYTPDYLNYYFNGKLLKTVDVRKLAKHDLYLWLSCIAKKPDATASGAVFFDYLRCYEMSDAAYKLRKKKFIDQLDSLKLPVKTLEGM